MFDVQVLAGRREQTLPEQTLASIAAYYARVTTAARPMNRLIATVMLATIAAIVLELVKGSVPDAVAWVSLALALAAIGVAGARTVPSAVRLGMRADTLELQSALARSICREHMFCLASIATLLALQLAYS
jgi:hypothetical protein